MWTPWKSSSHERPSDHPSSDAAAAANGTAGEHGKPSLHDAVSRSYVSQMQKVAEERGYSVAQGRASSGGAGGATGDAAAGFQGMSDASAATTSSQLVAALADADELRAALAQREAALLRREGENYLLTAQVQQLRRQLRKASQEANSCAANLAQALQGADERGVGGGLRGLKSERSRALVVTAHRSLQRLANGTLGDVCNTSSSSTAGAGGSQPPQTPSSLPASPGTSSVNDDGRQSPCRDVKASGAAAEGGHERLQAVEAERDKARTEAEQLKQKVEELTAAHAEQLQRLKDDLQAQASSSDASTCAGVLVSSAGASLAGSGSDGAPPGQEPNVRQEFLRQRALLLRVLRRSAEMEAEMTTLRDDVTRRNVIIHNQRQDLQQHQQNMQQQYDQFQQQQQQAQQQHHVQQLQQLQQLRELQQLLQQQQRQLQLQQGDTPVDGTMLAVKAAVDQLGEPEHFRVAAPAQEVP